MHTSNRFPSGRVLPAAGLLALLALGTACDSGPKGSASAGSTSGACGPAGDALAQSAVAQYVKLQTDPYPQRFLIAVGTDSALPEKGRLALQDKGPTYFFPKDSAQQRKVRAKLDSVGDYNTLLVAWKGVRQTDDAHAVVRLSGAFIGGKRNGTIAPVRAMQFACDSTGWHYTSAADEQHG